MATRCLTDVFILMRNNAIQSRSFYTEQNLSDRVSLVRHDSDLESGSSNRLPPAWVDGLEEVQYTMSRIRTKMKELDELHRRHLTRPTLDETSDEELQIDNTAKEVTKLFSHCQKLVHQIRSRSSPGTLSAGQQEEQLSRNVVMYVVTSLQDMTVEFRRKQSMYLKRLQSREETSAQYLDISLDFPTRVEPQPNLLLVDDETGITQDLSRRPQLSSHQQLLMLEDNTEFVEHREREVQNIVRSIMDLNEIFKDLAQMVVEQGTVVDRIDYNMESSQVKVKEGVKQLQKAETYQKKNRKMKVILVLAGTLILLIIILIAVKS